MKKFYAILSAIVLLSCNGCNEKSDCFTPPETFAFRLYNLQGKLLERKDFSSINIEYINSGNSERVDLTYFDIGEYFESTDLPWISADEGVKEFMLVYDQDKDTLYVDVQRFRRANSNCDLFQTRQVLFNKKPIELNQEYLYDFYLDK